MTLFRFAGLNKYHILHPHSDEFTRWGYCNVGASTQVSTAQEVIVSDTGGIPVPSDSRMCTNCLARWNKIRRLQQAEREALEK